MNYLKALVDTVFENVAHKEPQIQRFVEVQDSLNLESPISSPTFKKNEKILTELESFRSPQSDSQNYSQPMSISLSQFNPLRTSTPKSERAIRTPRRSTDGSSSSSSDLSQVLMPKKVNVSLTVNDPKEHRYRHKRRFTPENKDEACDWLMELKKTDPLKLKKILDEVGIDQKNFQKKIFINDTMKKVWKIKIQDAIGGKKYSQALESIFEGDTSVLEEGKQIDQQYVGRIMDQGGEIRYYNYILIDSRLCRKDTTEVIFEEFISAAFYIGKGTDNRAADHLKDALKFESPTGNLHLRNHPKLSHINEIWQEDGAVYIIRLFNDVTEDIAHLREEAMITSFGLGNLTNDRHGHQFKRPKAYKREMLSIHGAFLLEKAYHVFVNNLTPPIKKQNINWISENTDFEFKSS